MKEDSKHNDDVSSSQLLGSLATIKAELTWHTGPLPSPETVER
jgi:hypothetical protein